MTKRFKVPFAVQGDTAQIPDTVQTDGKVSYNQGFGHDYEKAYSDPQAKDIGREQLNGLFKDITGAIGEIQLQGVASHTAGEIYPKGSIVYFGSDLYISNIANNKDVPPKNWTSIKNIADDSLKKNSNLSDLKDAVIARKNLGLGDAATLGKTSALGNSEILLLTQKGGNDVNIAAVNAQKSANAANDKANQANAAAAAADGKAVKAQAEANKKRDFNDYDFKGELSLVSSSKNDFLNFGGKGDGYGIQVAIANNNSSGTFYFHDRVSANTIRLPISEKGGIIALTSDIDEVYSDQIFTFESSAPPRGYIARNGQAIDKNTMPRLYARYGTNMPDDRDRVHRMQGSLTGPIGSAQEDAMQKITGSLVFNGGENPSVNGAFSSASVTDWNNGHLNSGAAVKSRLSVNLDSSKSIGARTSTETRVKSRAVIFCNKIQ